MSKNKENFRRENPTLTPESLQALSKRSEHPKSREGAESISSRRSASSNSSFQPPTASIKFGTVVTRSTKKDPNSRTTKKRRRRRTNSTLAGIQEQSTPRSSHETKNPDNSQLKSNALSTEVDQSLSAQSQKIRNQAPKSLDDISNSGSTDGANDNSGGNVPLNSEALQSHQSDLIVSQPILSNPSHGSDLTTAGNVTYGTNGTPGSTASDANGAKTAKSSDAGLDQPLLANSDQEDTCCSCSIM